MFLPHDLQMTDDNLMYPNAASRQIFGEEHLNLFYFLGRILGKAMFEGITVQVRLALSCICKRMTTIFVIVISLINSILNKTRYLLH